MSSSPLLSPSLQADASPRPLFSVRASFFVAFFGGAGAAVVFTGLNSARLHRLGRDAWLLALLGTLAAGYSLLTGFPPALLEGLGPVGELIGEPKTRRFFGRGLGLLVWGAAYLAHRRFHRARELMSEDAPSPWKMGILATVVGGGAQVVLAMLARHLLGA